MKAATARDVEELIAPRGDLDAALSAGVVTREKVQGQWLYLAEDFTLESALDTALVAVERTLEEWLVNPGRFLFGLAARELRHGEFGKPTLTVLVHELCARKRLAGLPLLTKARQPYLAFYRLSDRGEIERQVVALRELLDTQGEVDWRDLPEPTRDVARKVWRNTIIGHGEWLGLGWQPESGVLRAW